jgi:hypothetical protein
VLGTLVGRALAAPSEEGARSRNGRRQELKVAQAGGAKISARPWPAIHPQYIRAGFEPSPEERHRVATPLQPPFRLSRINGLAIPFGTTQIRRDRSKEVAARLARRDFRPTIGKEDAEGSLPVLNHQIEFVDETVDFLEIFAAAFFRFDI